MGKITVKHYLNTNLKPYIVGEDKYYKIYLLIRTNNKNTKLKSVISDDEFTQEEYDEIIKDEDNIINKFIQIETNVYTKIIEQIEIDRKEFDIQILNTYILNYGQLLVGKLVEYLKWVKELDILKIEHKWSDAIQNRYTLDGDRFSETYKRFSTISLLIEKLRIYITRLDYSVNNDLFIYQWINNDTIDGFCQFWETETTKKEREYLFFDGMQAVGFINKILISMIAREATENLLSKYINK